MRLHISCFKMPRWFAAASAAFGLSFFLTGCGGGTGTSTSTSPPLLTSAAAPFVFSPYKDVGISLNWNTNVISTNVSGTLQPMLDVLPAGNKVVTLAFATGECGSTGETWAGINPDALAQANVSSFVSKNVNYILSTGGSAGVFTCGSDAGMVKFISRFASQNLVGVDFDIEGGQTPAQIQDLVQRVKNMQPLYPNLRWSFTLATLAPADNAPQGVKSDALNFYGDTVMKAIQSVGLTNYTINLMTMDYGSATPANCAMQAGAATCDMGQSAIQAARSLNEFWGVPYSQIELTPMIGGNDTPDETFTLQNVATVASWAKANGLAGLHFWSFDRDKDCPPGAAQPICNSYGQAGVLGFDQAFLNALQ